MRLLIGMLLLCLMLASPALGEPQPPNLGRMMAAQPFAVSSGETYILEVPEDAYLTLHLEVRHGSFDAASLWGPGTCYSEDLEMDGPGTLRLVCGKVDAGRHLVGFALDDGQGTGVVRIIHGGRFVPA